MKPLSTIAADISKVILFTMIAAGNSSPSYGGEKTIALSTYMKKPLNSATSVCEPGDSAGQNAICYLVTDLDETLTSSTDASGMMQAGAVSDDQGTFVEVKMDQLITSVSPDSFTTTQVFDFYMKLSWKGERKGTLSLALGDEHVLKGRVSKTDEGELEIQVTAVPSLMMLTYFMPTLDLAEMFGRDAQTESAQMKQEVELWMTLIIRPVLKAYIESHSVNTSLN